MAYLTYAEYTTMGGTVSEASFDDLEFESEALVNWYTFNRLKQDTQFPEELKRLMKYLVDTAYQKAQISNPSSTLNSGTSGTAVVSQSNDGVSVSYNVLSASEMLKSVSSESDIAIKRYLQGVTNEAGKKLLYRGLYEGE